MNAIEERAKKAGILCQYKSDYRYDRRSVESGYIQGATEQKAIDEEVRLKKCDDMTKEEYDREMAFADWYNKNGKGTPTYSDAIEWARKETIAEACEWLKERVQCGVHPQRAYGFAEEFRKAMEK